MTWRRPSISPAESSSASVPSSALPSGFFICVTLTRHSIGFFCGRTIAPLRGKFHAALLGLIHQRRDRGPGLAGGGRIDAVQPEHHGRVEHAAVAVAALERRAGPGREIAVARAVDEDAPDDGGAAGLGLDDQRADGVVGVHHDAGAERVEQDFGAVAEQQIVGRAFVGRGVVGLRLDLAERDMRLVQAAEPVDARQQFVGDAVHHLAVLAMDVGMQPAEVVTPAAVPMPPRKP